MFGGGRSEKDIAAGRFDCSSYVRWAYSQLGINLGPLTSTSTETLKNKGTAVKGGLANAQPGDLIFFDTYKKNGHVVIYLGNNQFIGAQGKTGVGIVDLNSSYGSYFKKRFSGNIRRIAGGGNVGAALGGGGAAMSGAGTGTAYRQAPSNLMGPINNAAKQYGVNPNLIAAIIKKESTFKSGLTSSAGAKGYMQLMPATARAMGVKNPWDTQQNINGGTKYIAQQLKTYKNNIPLALAAYNWGPGNLNKAIRKAGGSKDWNQIRRFAPKETRDYVDKIMGWR
ncbi:lytic tail fiber protein [Bacillus phage Palmer]|uniref:Tail lysin n=2 Tax=Pagevirus TaxID=1921184 RepID=A0A0A0RPZ1_9CAUD|nr:lytic tail fiber protein [Bacillus phage Pookie]YP_009210054.1 lytic tail fiber protein [Bacillus phage Palmer]AIW03704.1 tail lysin [Bacillus phage Pookie]AJK28086.1 peptidoglycan-degrading protein [Bacillus phage Palmer]